MKITNTASRLKEIMDERGLRQIDILNAAKPFCEKYGVKLAKNDLSQYVNGKVEPGQEKLTILGLALNVSETWLMGYDVGRAREQNNSQNENKDIDNYLLPLPTMKKWQVIGGTACGSPLHRELDEVIMAPADIDADRVFRCVGDSMIGAHIFDGDLVFVKTGEQVENGRIAVVRIEDEYTLKRIYRGEDYLELRSENPKYPPIIIRGEQENAEIVGKAVQFLSRVV